MIGLLSDLLVVRSPVHFVGCSLGAMFLAFFSQIRDKSHTTALSLFWCSFNAFESGATIMIAVLICEIGKKEQLKNNHKAVATFSGIGDGLACFGTVLG